MRIALYDFSALVALTTIEFPDEELMSTTPWKKEIELRPGVLVTVSLIAYWFYLPLENKPNPKRTYAAMAAGPKSSALVRTVFFDEPHDDIPVQHKPQAVRAIREAFRMGDIR